MTRARCLKQNEMPYPEPSPPLFISTFRKMSGVSVSRSILQSDSLLLSGLIRFIARLNVVHENGNSIKVFLLLGYFCSLCSLHR